MTSVYESWAAEKVLVGLERRPILAPRTSMRFGLRGEYCISSDILPPLSFGAGQRRVLLATPKDCYHIDLNCVPRVLNDGCNFR